MNIVCALVTLRHLQNQTTLLTLSFFPGKPPECCFSKQYFGNVLFVQ